jgi:DNA-binding LacI/PurR family transcriptional regulator/curved DNA-binding protein CbpA
MMNDTAKRRRIKIGLLVSHLEDDFDDAVAEGAMIGAEQCDADLVIFPGRYIDGIYADKLRTVYEYQYNTLFDMAAANKFDVLLVLIGTLGTYLDNKHKAQFLKKFAGTPVITITAHIDGYPCIMLDNRTGMKEAIEHLIKVHGCKKIGMVSGPKTSDDALERLDVYKETLEENGIIYDEKRVAYGNFSKFCVDEVGKLIDDNPELDAIVFANDQMAIAGYKAMEERGIRPGKDILVTGFDDDPVAEELNPHLTTVKADPSELGYHAVQEAVNYVVNKAINNDKISSEMVRRNSCGCQGNSKLKTISFGRISDDPEAFARRMSQFLFNKYSASETTAKMRENYVKIIYALDDYAREENLDNEIKKDKVLEMTSTLASEEFYKVYEAYETLSDVEKRKIYNETQLILIKSNEIIRQPKTAEEWNESFRKAIIKKIKELEEKLEAKELSFNGFYDYCDKFLPLYLNNKKHSITEREFNLRTFLFVLKDFYKGGRYGTTERYLQEVELWKRGRKKIVKCKFTRAEYIEFSQLWEWHRKNYLAERKRMRELFQIAYYDKFKMYASETCDEYEAQRSKKKDSDLTMEDILAINMMAAACKNKSFYKQIGEANDDEDDE